MNAADSLIFQTEKQMEDLGDKLPADKKQPITDALEKLKTAHKAEDIATMDAAMAELNTVFSCLLYTSPSPRDRTRSRMPSSA